MNKRDDELERLIVRLYEAMGYVAMRNGGSGDQGADVIASKGGKNYHTSKMLRRCGRE